jgi:hypothetical protein
VFHFGQPEFRAFGFVFSRVYIAAARPLCLLAVVELALLAAVPGRVGGRLFTDHLAWGWGWGMGASHGPCGVPQGRPMGRPYEVPPSPIPLPSS